MGVKDFPEKKGLIVLFMALLLMAKMIELIMTRKKTWQMIKINFYKLLGGDEVDEETKVSSLISNQYKKNRLKKSNTTGQL
jgi:hypothetical protein